jgi:hypothetical protein
VENDIKMDLREIGWVAWTKLIRLRIGTSELRVLQNVGKPLSRWVTGRISALWI